MEMIFKQTSEIISDLGGIARGEKSDEIHHSRTNNVYLRLNRSHDTPSKRGENCIRSFVSWWREDFFHRRMDTDVSSQQNGDA